MKLIPRKHKKSHVKEKLKRATYELLAEKGYASVSTRDIVKRADTALGQLTYYYKTKDSLINEVLDEIIEELIAKLEDNVNNATDKKQAIKDSFLKFLEYNDNTQRIVIDFISQSFYNNNLSIKSSDMIDRISNIIEKVIMDEDSKSKEEAEIETQNYVNYILGVLIRHNIKFKQSETVSAKLNSTMTPDPVYN